MDSPNGSSLPIQSGSTGGPLWRKTWQTDTDVALRRTVVATIFQLFEERRGPVPALWEQKVAGFIKRLEESLYRSAATKKEYADWATLESRLQTVAKRITSANQCAPQRAPQRAPQHESQIISSSLGKMVPNPGYARTIVPTPGTVSYMIPTPGGISNMVPTPGHGNSMLPSMNNLMSPSGKMGKVCSSVTKEQMEKVEERMEKMETENTSLKKDVDVLHNVIHRLSQKYVEHKISSKKVNEILESLSGLFDCDAMDMMKVVVYDEIVSKMDEKVEDTVVKVTMDMALRMEGYLKDMKVLHSQITSTVSQDRLVEEFGIPMKKRKIENLFPTDSKCSLPTTTTFEPDSPEKKFLRGSPSPSLPITPVAGLEDEEEKIVGLDLMEANPAVGSDPNPDVEPDANLVVDSDRGSDT